MNEKRGKVVMMSEKRFREKYHKYCQEWEEEMNVCYSDKRRVIMRKLV